ncbi:MAG TPA: hypothetical protein VGL77_18715 [Armatimonadota bacterium]|jgi:hypothetical protein
MSLVKGVFTFMLLMGMATAVLAAPNFLGPTGLLLTPTVETLTKGSYNVSLNVSADADSNEYALNYGINPNFEVGFSRLPSEPRLNYAMVAYKAPRYYGPNTTTIINAKYNFKAETAKGVGFSLGVMDLTEQTNATVYLVAGKQVDLKPLAALKNLRANLGIAVSDNDGIIPLDGIFGGVSFDVTPRVTLMLEHDSQRLNYGARVNLFKGVTGQVGFAGDKHPMFIGICYGRNL